MKRAALIIAGTHSGSGKTTITLGIMAALKKRGVRVQPFKCGPDYIDPSLHNLVTGEISRNLDLYMMSREACNKALQKSENADIAIIEGVMGMFDGGDGSSAHLGCELQIPTLLVIDARSMAESAAAIVRGFEELAPGSIIGVIANNIASDRHYQLVRSAIEQYCSAPLLGYLPKNSTFVIPSRHLGLHLAQDQPLQDRELLADTVERCIDLKLLLTKAKERAITLQAPPKKRSKRQCRIAVARDKAFCFYYQDNLDALEEAGATLLFFSPLIDQLPKNIDGIYLGGGYPELYGQELSANTSLHQEIRDAAQAGMPIYAECGGFMYLSAGIKSEGDFFPLVNIFAARSVMNNKRSRLGYREIILKQKSPLGEAGAKMRGHEFHYSHMDEEALLANNDYQQIYQSERGGNGFLYRNCLGSYVHLHFGSNPTIATNFIQLCLEHSGRTV